MRITYKFYACIFATVMVSACSTPEYQSVERTCSAKYRAEIPTNFVQQTYNATRSRQVPTGQTTCMRFGNIIDCQQTMRTEFYTEPAVRTVDTNRARRESRIRSCTWQTCRERFGNNECRA